MFTRSGFITGYVLSQDEGYAVHGPLEFDEALVSESGTWLFPDAATPEDALDAAYTAAYPDWVGRDPFPTASARSRALPDARMHTPCPALWAGR